MGIVNKRNAVLGWAVWRVGKRIVRRKAKDAVPRLDESRRPNKPAIASALAAVGGLFWFKRRRRKGAESGSDSEA